MELPNNLFEAEEESEITTPCSRLITNPTVHLIEPSITLDLTLGFTNTTGQLFSCNYCRRKFYSSQALGGHQNAHKQERRMEERAMTLKMLSERYASMASLPLQGSSSPLHGSASQTLGIEAHVSLHQAVQAISGGEIFDHSYLGIPTYMEVDEAKPLWYDSFRHIIDVGCSSATFDHSYLGIPIYMEVDEAQPYWYDSFRHIIDVGCSSATFDHSYLGIPIYMEVDEAQPYWYDSFRHIIDVGCSSATPDLTLKL